MLRAARFLQKEKHPFLELWELRPKLLKYTINTYCCICTMCNTYAVVIDSGDTYPRIAHSAIAAFSCESSLDLRYAIRELLAEDLYEKKKIY